MSRKHPRLRLFSWHPLLAAVPFSYLVHRVSVRGFTTLGTITLAVVTIWFVLAVVDLATRHRYLDWLYSEDDIDGQADGG